jgi:hypothetical protein
MDYTVSHFVQVVGQDEILRAGCQSVQTPGGSTTRRRMPSCPMVGCYC